MIYDADNFIMTKDRGQIRINLPAPLKAEFDRVVEARAGGKPGKLAADVFAWYLSQPEFVRMLIHGGPTLIPPKLREEWAAQLVDYLAGNADAAAAAASIEQMTKPARGKRGPDPHRKSEN
jgi:hypothetical protein